MMDRIPVRVSLSDKIANTLSKSKENCLQRKFGCAHMFSRAVPLKGWVKLNFKVFIGNYVENEAK